MMFFYSAALALAALLGAPVWGWRMLRQGRYRAGLRRRLGAVPPRLTAWVAARPVVWVHAVSVGETLAATRLLAELESALPDHAIVLSTTTPTGQRVAQERLGPDRVFFYPLDLAFAVRPYLRALQPALLVLIESELWPRMLTECARANTPVAVVNARVSDRSLPRYMALQSLWRPLLGRVRLLLAQSDEDARRWRGIGAQPGRVITTGNLKYDLPPPPESPLAALLRRHLPANAPVLVCGSTHNGEEALLLNCLPRNRTPPSVTILAPRHPERAVQVAAAAHDRGLPAILLSEWRRNASPLLPGTVLVVDTVGDLASLYTLATVAFVGGSLVPRGGQNPWEPARLGVPVVMGPSRENFRDIADGLARAQAIHLVTTDTVCKVLQPLLHGGAAQAMGERGRAFTDSLTGATGRTVQALLHLLRERAG